ncbi:hypothetical protein PSEUDO8Z_160163 [Pseudomonas sp. 8Z]|nr:hypothetical protein PSEUDO8Z_160163 [Pseudomonas sp. 8Z]
MQGWSAVWRPSRVLAHPGRSPSFDSVEYLLAGSHGAFEPGFVPFSLQPLCSQRTHLFGN